MAGKLFFINRFDWLVPKDEKEFNRFFDEVFMPDVLKRPGFVSGARYKIERGPEYEGWSGPDRAYQYLHIYELEDSEAAIQSALRPVSQMHALPLWKGSKPLMQSINEVRVVYRRIYGDMDFPSLVYTTRLNWLYPEIQAEWDKFHETITIPNALKRPGFVRATRHLIERGPIYGGWDGPSRACQYINIFELADEPKSIEAAMRPTSQIPSPGQWWGKRPLVENLTLVRAVYRRIGPLGR